MRFSNGSTSSDFIKGKEKVVEPQHPKRSKDNTPFTFLRHGYIASKCPNKRVMVVHEKHRELVSSDEVETELKDEIGEEEQGEDFELAQRDLLVVQWILNAQVDVNEEQCENIFHMRCQVRTSFI